MTSPKQWKNLRPARPEHVILMTLPQSASNQDRPQIELRCVVDSSMLGLMREFICSVARHIGFSEKHVAEIEISVDEACANAMEHAYVRAANAIAEQNLTVEISYSGEEMTIRITDYGTGTTEQPQGIPRLEEYLDSAREQYRGLGFLLMQRFMDRVDVRSAPGHGTTVEMTKIRPK